MPGDGCVDCNGGWDCEFFERAARESESDDERRYESDFKSGRHHVEFW